MERLRSLRDKLVDRGMPAEGIRYIHQARDDLEKARLFAACRAGQVSVIVGSTQKLGVGTKFSRGRSLAPPRLPAAACGHRPARRARQGNQNPIVAHPPLRD